MPSQGDLARGVTIRTGQDPWQGASLSRAHSTPPYPPPILEALQSFITASFEMHVFLIGNILIVPLISFRLHEK